MILKELIFLYGRLLEKPKTVQQDGGIYPVGFSGEIINFRIVISAGGHFVGIDDLRFSINKQRLSRPFLVPKRDGKRTGSGFKPYFLWDNRKYILGIDKHENPEARRSFSMYIREVLSLTGRSHKFIEAVLTFLSSNREQTKLRRDDNWINLSECNGFIGFKISGEPHALLTECTEIKNIWTEYLRIKDDEAKQLLDIVTGRNGPVYPFHPTIKLPIGKSGKNDIPLISFNIESFCSYGKRNNFNAQISRQTAFSFTAAINYLMRDPDHHFRIGDTLTLFWADRPTKMVRLFRRCVLSLEKTHHTDNNQENHLEKKIKNGFIPEEFLKDNSRFFILILTPNAARVVVRFWHSGTTLQIASALSDHFGYLKHRLPRLKKSLPGIAPLLRELAPGRKDNVIPSPQIVGLFRSIILRRPYPLSILFLLLQRIKTDREDRASGILKTGFTRMVFIKAILNRNFSKELTMSLDTDRKDPSYLSGRLFSVLENIHKEANRGRPHLSFKERYFFIAAANPKFIFPRLLLQNQRELKTLDRELPKSALFFDHLLQSILNLLTDFPRPFSIEEKGLFIIGYYQQMQELSLNKIEV